VDDLFWPEDEVTALQSQALIVRFVAALGLVLAPDKTPPSAASMPLLGIVVTLVPTSSGLEVHLSPDPAKLEFWLDSLASMATGRPATAAEVEQLTGRLCFAVASLWGPAARAKMSALYSWSQCGGRPSEECLEVISWWRTHLMSGDPVVLRLSPDPRPPLILYTDAEGKGGIGAILVDPEAPLADSPWFGTRVPDSVVRLLLPRKTQINPLELVALVYAVLCFLPRLQDRRFVVFIDNSTALSVARKGTGRVADMRVLSHFLHRLLHLAGARAWFLWVPSKLNWSDPPSRGLPPLCGTPFLQKVPWTDLLTVLSRG